MSAVTLLTNAFASGALEHPGDENTPPRPIIIPGFRNTGMSDEQTESLRELSAKLLAEAAIHTLETGGKTIIDTAELAQLRAQAAAAPEGRRVISICTGPVGEPVLQVTITKSSDRAIVPASALKAVGESL